jgi:transposase
MIIVVGMAAANRVRFCAWRSISPRYLLMSIHCTNWCATWLRKWRTIDPSSVKRKPRSKDSSSSFGASNARSSDGGRNGSMATSLLSDWKTSTLILPACKRLFREHRRTMSVRSLCHAGRDFPSICRAKTWRSILMDASVPCCGNALHVIGETVSETLDFVPARLRVLRIRRPKYGCPTCGTIHQAAAPERPIAKGMASPGLLAHVLVSKYCDHTPLYRQSQIFARHGVEIERSTLANWVGGACWWLEPLQARLAAHVFGSDKIFADDTTIPVLDPGRGRTKTGRLWVYTRDDRPWSGPDPPAAVYFYSPDRKAERPASHLEAFHGVLQVDGYAGFERLTERGDIVLAACWAHTRRKFFDVHEATGSPIAAEALRRIAELYAIEKLIRGRTAQERRSARNTQSRPLVEAMKPWLEMQLGRIPGRGGLADAIRYTLSRWPALRHFLDDGRIELDNNSVERAIRPVALGRKNHLFAGSDGGAERWATVCSLIASAKLNDVEPSQGHPPAHDRGSSYEPVRRPAALELAKNARQALIRCDRGTLTPRTSSTRSWCGLRCACGCQTTRMRRRSMNSAKTLTWKATSRRYESPIWGSRVKPTLAMGLILCCSCSRRSTSPVASWVAPQGLHSSANPLPNSAGYAIFGWQREIRHHG